MKVPVYYSTLTRNTRKVAEGIDHQLSEEGRAVLCENSREVKEPAEGDAYVLCFWCNKGNMDPVSMDMVQKLEGRNIVLVGTMGAKPGGPYEEKVKKTVLDFVGDRCQVLGIFICQGKIDEAITDRRRSLPPDSPGYLSDERYKSHLESRKHPDEQDIRNAKDFVTATLDSFEKDR